MAEEAVPGTGMGPTDQQPSPPAGESNTDTTATGPPETIPYARFKEVNDELTSLRGYAQLRDWGYDPDSLGRLAQFETAYMQDPAGVVAQLAENLDLPPEVLDALKAGASTEASSTPAGSSEPSAAQGEPSDDGQSTSSPDLKYLLERERKREEQERLFDQTAREEMEKEAADELLGKVLGHWNTLDTQDGIEFAEDQKLTYIAAVGGAGAFTTAEEMAEAARQAAMSHRESMLGGAVRSRPTGLPLTVPGSASTASPPVSFGGDIKEATKAARAAIERGEIPGG